MGELIHMVYMGSDISPEIHNLVYVDQNFVHDLVEHEICGKYVQFFILFFPLLVSFQNVCAQYNLRKSTIQLKKVAFVDFVYIF